MRKDDNQSLPLQELSPKLQDMFVSAYVKKIIFRDLEWRNVQILLYLALMTVRVQYDQFPRAR